MRQFPDLFFVSMFYFGTSYLSKVITFQFWKMGSLEQGNPFHQPMFYIMEVRTDLFLYMSHGVKSCSMLSVMNLFKTFLTFLVPNWFRRFKEVTPSLTVPNKYDNPIESVDWLRHFTSQNGTLLQELDVYLYYIRWTYFYTNFFERFLSSLKLLQLTIGVSVRQPQRVFRYKSCWILD